MATDTELLEFLALIGASDYSVADDDPPSLSALMIRTLKPPSERAISEAFNVLTNISVRLIGTGDEDQKEIKEISAHFYECLQLPFPPFGHETIDSMSKVGDKIMLLKSLLAKTTSQDPALPLISNIIDEWIERDLARRCEERLGCLLEPLPKNSPDFILVNRYIMNSPCCYKRLERPTPVSVLRVRNRAVNRQFEKFQKFQNRQILWHGSRIGNWVGILRLGLQIRPPQVKCNGRSFGDGLYFTNKVLKAHRYSSCGRDGRSVLLLSEVALGTSMPLELSTNGRNYVHVDAGGKSTMDYHSCYVPGRCYPDAKGNVVDENGAIWPVGSQIKCLGSDVHHPEFVVFNTHQTRMRFIVVVEGGTPMATE